MNPECMTFLFFKIALQKIKNFITIF